MKKIFTLILFAAICLPAMSQNKTYVIKGAVEQLNPETKLVFNDWGVKDGVEIVIENGTFEIKGELEEGTYPRVASITIMRGKSSSGNNVILEPGEIKVSFDNRMKITVGGTPENENLQRLNGILSKYDDASGAAFYAWQAAYNKKASEQELEELWKKSEDIREEAREIKLKVLKENDNYASLVLTPGLTRYEGANITGQFVKQFERFSYTKGYQSMKEHYDAMARCTDGAMVKNFTLPAPDGKMVSLSDFRGKWVLLDFWYVGCHWCRKLAPNLGKIYKEYKGKLEIISINVDKESDKDKMMKVIEEDGMVWVQVNDKTKKDLPEYFGVSGYPTLFLIDPQGKGIAMKVGYCEAGGLRRFLDKYMK